MFDVIVALPSSSKEGDEATDDACLLKADDDEDTITKSDVDKMFSAKQTSTAEETRTSDEPPPINNIQRASQLAFLPTKFRKLVWIKRNDFVIVDGGDEIEDEEKQQKLEQKDSSSGGGGGGGGGFRYVITNILYKDQVKHIKSKGLWPSDSFFANDDGGEKDGEKMENEEYNNPDDNDDGDGTYEENGIVFDDPLEDEDLMMINTNRIATLRVEDSSDSEDE